MFITYRNENGDAAAIEIENIVRIVCGWPEAAIYYRDSDKVECLRSADTVDTLVKKINGTKTINYQNAMIENLQGRIKDLEQAVTELRDDARAHRPNKHLQVKALRLNKRLRRAECG